MINYSHLLKVKWLFNKIDKKLDQLFEYKLEIDTMSKRLTINRTIHFFRKYYSSCKNIIKKMMDDNNYSSVLLSKVREEYSLKSIKYLYEIYNFDIDIASKNLIKEMIGDIQEIIRLLSYINA